MITYPQTILQWMQLAVATLFRSDANGRLRSVNEPGTEYPAPRFYMGRTAGGNLWRFRYDLPDTLVEELEQICRAEPVCTDLTHEPQQADAIRAALQSYAPITESYRGPAYSLPETLARPSQTVLIRDENAGLLEPGFPWMLPLPQTFDYGPIAAVVVDDSAVSVCFCSRLSQHAAEAGLETLEHVRGKGYAAQTVAAWSVAVRQRGLVPIYSTSWGNIASQRVAQKLGMHMFGEDWSIG